LTLASPQYHNIRFAFNPEPAPDGGFVVFDTPLTPGTLPACGWVPAEHMEVIA